jgi:hypothetical protein
LSPGRVAGFEPAFLAQVPVEFDAGGAFEQGGCQALALRNAFVDGEHGRFSKYGAIDYAKAMPIQPNCLQDQNCGLAPFPF